MGLFDFNLRRSINNWLGVTKINSLSTIPIGTPEVYTQIDTAKAITEGYNGNTAVFSILNKDAQKFAAIPTYLYKKDDEDQEKIENDLSKLIQYPNEYQGQDAFRATLRTYFKLTGEAFIWLNRGDLEEMDDRQRRKKPILEMYVLPSDHMLVIPDPNNLWGVIGYKLEAGGQRLEIPKSDIIHWKNTNLKFDVQSRDHLRGFSPLSAGYKTLQQNNDATAASVRMYQNDGSKGILMNETLDKLAVDQRATIEGVVNRKINSSDIKGAVATLQGKWSYIDLGKSNTDLGLLEGKNISMMELCFLFDVPYTLFDPNTSFANAEWAQKNWLNNSIIPAAKQWDDECNRVLPMAFDLEGTAELRCDPDALPEMQEDNAKLVASLGAAWWITPNEKREWMGFEPLEGEFDEPMIPSGVQPLSLVGEGMDEIEKRVQELNGDDNGI